MIQYKSTTLKLTAAIVVLAGGLASANARDLTVVGFGGAIQKAQREALFAPLGAQGVKVVEDEWDGSLAKIRSQVQTKAVVWDVVQVEGAELELGCSEGLLEKIDPALFGAKDQYLKDSLHPCGFGATTWASVLAYDGDRLKDGPKTWADFWDTQKFPGKRGMRFSPKETLEQALLADGVAPADLYKVMRTPEGIDRAFRKLDQLKASIVWWKSGAEHIQRLASGEVVMTSAWNGRPVAANETDKRNFKIVWDAGSLFGMDYWAIPTGTPEREKANKLLALWAKPEPEAEFAKRVAYGGPNKASYKLLDEARMAILPSSPQNLKAAASIDYVFWNEGLEDLSKRFSAWAAK